MGKHGKNATANPVYSSHERRKDSKSEGYGGMAVRLSSDSLQEIDHCWLTLQPARNPLITPDGYIFDKEAIYENLLHQKTSIARALKEYERQKSKADTEKVELAAAEEQAKIEAFKRQEESLSTTLGNHFKKEEEVGDATLKLRVGKVRVQTIDGKKEPVLPSFWLPSLAPESKSNDIKKPDTVTRCPITGKPLKIKDLIPVNFTPIDPTGRKKDTATLSVGGAITNKNADDRYMCPITQTVLRKVVSCYVLRPSGRVVTAECVEKIIRPEMRDPISDEALTEKDLIPVHRGGSGFAGSGATLEVKVATPSIAIS
eukprot:m.23271 g.23271  ORF g.23271 m.23271 type:complete len:315 (+) comp3882_c0_seq1:205-1149(+)